MIVNSGWPWANESHGSIVRTNAGVMEIAT